ncbi:hypothetical protein [Aquimarina longa]|uniref:hypothetical protein n=1 Tax=Aquimarina longa TaxID=1080221 RepID=UPI000784D9DC|nr:hypothetical protein [Aquimarina longa]
MKNKILTITGILLFTLFSSCSQHTIDLSGENLELVNRNAITSNQNTPNTLILNNKEGAGMAILKNENFDNGTIELELKGENNPGKSFVGLAFNIQNDSTYEAIYFRPFNFKANELEKREHSVQYISHPKNTWKFLRTNQKGLYEAEYINAPLPDEWFEISVKIDNNNVYVYDKKTNTELLSIKRLEKQVSSKIGLWTGYNSKGEFRNLKIKK